MNFDDLTKKFFDMATPKKLKEWIDVLSDKVEELTHSNNQKDQKIVELEAQIRKLKGLTTKPEFKDKTSVLDIEDDDNKKKNTREKRSDAAKKERRKKKDLKIDKVERIVVPKDDLDSSFKYKGTRRVVIQDITFARNNVAFDLEKYHSKKLGRTIEADLPIGYDGGYFGPHLIAFIKASHYEGDVTIKKIYKLLTSIDIKISIKQINRIINDCPDDLQLELDNAREAGIKKADYQQIDDTTTSVLSHGNVFTTVTCNPYFTYLTTGLRKNRANAVYALSGQKGPLYKLNQHAIMVAFISLKSFKIELILKKYQGDNVYNTEDLEEFLKNDDIASLSDKALRDIRTAMYVGALYDGHLGNIGKGLVSDDAPQFNNISEHHSLCWYHEMRHYKELSPAFKEHEMLLDMFFSEVKQMYRTLKKWQKDKKEELRDYIFKWFNEYFKEKTGYQLLDNRKKLTFEKMEKLLAVLWSPLYLPLDNNESERDLRGRKLKQKISLFDRTMSGAKARDFYFSIKQTCRKNGVSFYEYLLDRQKEIFRISQLGEIIELRSPQH